MHISVNIQYRVDLDTFGELEFLLQKNLIFLTTTFVLVSKWYNSILLGRIAIGDSTALVCLTLVYYFPTLSPSESEFSLRRHKSWNNVISKASYSFRWNNWVADCRKTFWCNSLVESQNQHYFTNATEDCKFFSFLTEMLNSAHEWSPMLLQFSQILHHHINKRRIVNYFKYKVCMKIRLNVFSDLVEFDEVYRFHAQTLMTNPSKPPSVCTCVCKNLYNTCGLFYVRCRLILLPCTFPKKYVFSYYLLTVK